MVSPRTLPLVRTLTGLSVGRGSSGDVEVLTLESGAGVLPGVFHGFDMVAPKAQVSRRFFASQCDALRSGLGLAD